MRYEKKHRKTSMTAGPFAKLLLGVADSQLEAVSFGKERPVALASNEGAWAQNRRAASVIIN